KLAIEITLAQLQNLLKHVGCARFVAIHCKHSKNRVEAVALCDEFANLRRLKVSDRNILRALWSLKTGVEIRHLEPAFLRERAHKKRVPIIAPTGAGASLFVNGKTLGEPPRDTVVSHLQRDDVRVFVPERAAPIELARFARRW